MLRLGTKTNRERERTKGELFCYIFLISLAAPFLTYIQLRQRGQVPTSKNRNGIKNILKANILTINMSLSHFLRIFQKTRCYLMICAFPTYGACMHDANFLEICWFRDLSLGLLYLHPCLHLWFFLLEYALSREDVLPRLGRSTLNSQKEMYYWEVASLSHNLLLILYGQCIVSFTYGHFSCSNVLCPLLIIEISWKKQQVIGRKTNNTGTFMYLFISQKKIY